MIVFDAFLTFTKCHADRHTCTCCAVPMTPFDSNKKTTKTKTKRRPIEIKDEHLDEYQKGGDAAFAVAQKISAKLDAHLRHVTLAVPNWAEELRGYCNRQGWQAPEFSVYVMMHNES